MSINFLKYRKIYYVFAGVLISGSLASLIRFGLNLGIDFTGGSILEIEYLEQRPSNQEILGSLSDLDLGTITIQPSGEGDVIIRMKDISEETHQKIIQSLGKDKKIEEKRFESIGPTIGRELKQKTNTLITISLFSIVLYISLAFRKVQRPVKSWHYGISSLLTLFHDIFIPLGVLAVLGKFYNVQLTIPIIAAFLTILGYSINNTVVVFDRMRENLIRRTAPTLEEIVNNSLNQTLTRCLNTSLTTLLPLFAIFFWGGETLRYFSLVLIIGITAGLFSSLFLASPMLVSWLGWRRKGRA